MLEVFFVVSQSRYPGSQTPKTTEIPKTPPRNQITENTIPPTLQRHNTTRHLELDQQQKKLPTPITFTFGNLKPPQNNKPPLTPKLKKNQDQSTNATNKNTNNKKYY